MSAARVSLIVNPSAGAGRGARVAQAAERALEARGVALDVLRTSRPGEGSDLARRALRAGCEGVVVIGGDGTLSEVTDGFFEGRAPIRPDAWLAPLSAGTGGDFRRTLGAANVVSGERAVEAAIDRIWSAAVRPIDVGHLEYVDAAGAKRERVFLNIASFGVGGLVDRLVNDAPKWMGGRMSFFVGTLRALARYEPARVRVSVDGGPPTEARVTNVAVANGQYFGGGMHVAPTASLDDGLFDVVTMHALDTPRALALASSVYRGTHLGREGIEHRRGRVVVAEPVDPSVDVLLDVDGEAPGRLPAHFENLPRALRLRG